MHNDFYYFNLDDCSVSAGEKLLFGNKEDDEISEAEGNVIFKMDMSFADRVKKLGVLRGYSKAKLARDVAAAKKLDKQRADRDAAQSRKPVHRAELIEFPVLAAAK